MSIERNQKQIIKILKPPKGGFFYVYSFKALEIFEHGYDRDWEDAIAFLKYKEGYRGGRVTSDKVSGRR
jgi:hypothetical protein